MDFEIDGKKYRTVPMDTFVALALAQKLSPIITGVLSVRGMLAQTFALAIGMTKKAGGDGAKPDGQRLSESIDAIGPAIDQVAKGIANLPEEEFIRILGVICSAVSREVGVAGYAPIYSDTAKRLMYNDIRPKHAIQIMRHVIEENFMDFF